MKESALQSLLVKRLKTYSGSGGASVALAVPVVGRVAKALADGDGLVAKVGESGKHELSEVVGSLLVDVVANGEPLVVGWGSTSGSDVSFEVVLCVLDLLGSVLVVVIGVDVEVGDVVA